MESVSLVFRNFKFSLAGFFIGAGLFCLYGIPENQLRYISHFFPPITLFFVFYALFRTAENRSPQPANSVDYERFTPEMLAEKPKYSAALKGRQIWNGQKPNIIR
jgi:hypothetical protein